MKADIKTVKILRELTGLSLEECLNALKQTDNNIDKAIELLNDKNILSDDKAVNLLTERNNQTQLKCPKCGASSENIQVMKRGWGLLSGFIGSGKNQRVCKICLYKW